MPAKRKPALYETNDGHWHARGEIMLDGKMKRVGHMFDTPGEGVNYLAYLSSLNGNQSRVGATLEKVLAYRASTSKAGEYREQNNAYIAKRFLRIWGPDKIMVGLTQDDIDHYAIVRGEEGCGKGIKEEINYLKSALKKSRVVYNWYTPHDLITCKTPDLYMPTDAEFKAIWDVASSDCRDIITMVMFLGLRPMETVRLNNSMINIAENTIDIPAEARKCNRANRIPITATLRAMMDRRRVDLMGSLFKRTSRETKREMKKAGVLWKGFRPFRRAMVSWAEDAGFSLDQIALVTGHTRGGMTARYSDTVGKLDLKREVLEAVESRFLSITKPPEESGGIEGVR